MEESSGNFFIKRSVWVPLPTPGAPTRIIRAALESFWTVMVCDPNGGAVVQFMEFLVACE
jgi:hypothetical protein